MLILNAQELESQGIPYRAASKLLFQERLFVKGQSFSQRVRQVAINLYEEYLSSGIHCLLVESAEQLTFWRELEALSPEAAIDPTAIKPGTARTQRSAPADDIICINLQHRGSSYSSGKPQPASPNRAMPQATIQVKYRGAIVTLPSVGGIASVQDQAQPPSQAVRRTYRGAAY